MEELENLILQELDRSADSKERIEKIDDLLHRLNFERRLSCLSDEEREDMVSAGRGRMTPEMREKIDACKSEAERDALIHGYARAQYFRQCAWADYLNGVSQNKPFYPTQSGSEAAKAA